MKRLIFTLSVIMIAGLAGTAYSQVSVHASINLGRTGIYVSSAPVAYEHACAPAPAPCYDNRARLDVVIGNPGYDRRYNERREVRYEDRNYRDRDNRDRDYRRQDARDRRDNDYDHDRRNKW